VTLKFIRRGAYQELIEKRRKWCSFLVATGAFARLATFSPQASSLVQQVETLLNGKPALEVLAVAVGEARDAAVDDRGAAPSDHIVVAHYQILVADYQIVVASHQILVAHYRIVVANDQNLVAH